MQKVTCIIAAYNEAERIGKVLHEVLHHPKINEVIVVDDGSTDNTAEIVRKFRRVKQVSYKFNRGKTHALLAGVKKAKGSVLLLLDADLEGLNKKNISDLLAPVLTGTAEVSMAVDYNSSCAMKFWISFMGLENFSGLRAFHRSIIQDKSFRKIPGYGFEAFLNEGIIQKRLRLKKIYWNNVSNTLKTKKLGLVRGLGQDLTMVFQEFRTIGVFGSLRQKYKLRALEVD